VKKLSVLISTRSPPSDPDFWERVEHDHTLKLVMLALPKLNTSLEVVEHLKNASFEGQVAATSKFPDEVESLKEHGVNIVFNVYTEAGTGFATHIANISIFCKSREVR